MCNNFNFIYPLAEPRGCQLSTSESLDKIGQAVPAIFRNQMTHTKIKKFFMCHIYTSKFFFCIYCKAVNLK